MITTVLGRRGCGKTTIIKEKIENISRLVILDTLAEFDNGDIISDPIEFINELSRLKDGYFQIVFRPFEIEPLKAFDIVAKSSWIVGDMLSVIDEIDLIASPISIPFELSRNLRYGRHRGLSMIAASRRAAEIPRLLTSQSDEIISFNQSEPRDIQYLASCCGNQFAEMTSNLQRFQYLQFDPFDPLKIPEIHITKVANSKVVVSTEHGSDTLTNAQV
jgi:AAA+ ATPase superfamily predicted ATPase